MCRRQSATRVLLLSAVTVAACGQSQPPAAEPEIVTDRPDITESSIVIPKGSLQLENGLTWTNDQDGRWAKFLFGSMLMTRTCCPYGRSCNTSIPLHIFLISHRIVKQLRFRVEIQAI